MELNVARVDHLLKEKGLRPTHARRRILALLLNHESHLSADEVLKALRRAGYQGGLATIYQNLAALADVGLLIRFTGIDGLVRFDSNLVPHHHLICIKCGKVEDVCLTETSTSTSRVGNRDFGKIPSRWKIESVQYELKGICPACGKRK